MKLTNGTESVEIPRVLLAERSPFFKQLVASSFREGTQTEISLIDENIAEINHTLLNYLKTGNNHLVTLENAIELLKLSDKYGLSSVNQRCQDILIAELKDNPLAYPLNEWKEYANKYNAPALEQFIIFLEKDIPLARKTLTKLFEAANSNEFGTGSLIPENLSFIKEKGKYLTSLTFSDNQQLFNIIMDACPNITELTTTKTNLTKYIEYRSEMRKELPALKRLKFEESPMFDKESPQSVLTQIASNFPELQYLDAANLKLNDELIDFIAQHFPNLTGLAINLFHIKNTSVLNQLNRLTHLKEITIVGYDKLDDEILRNIMKNLEGVTKLDLRYCNNISENLLIELCKRFKNTLTSLGLSFSKNQVNLSKSIASDLLHLEELNLFGLFPENDIHQFLSSCSKLKQIFLDHCAFTNKLCQLLPKNVQNLETLSVFDGCPLNSESIVALTQLPQLKKATLHGCSFEEDVKESLIINMLYMPNLQYLNITETFSFVKKGAIDEMKTAAKSRGITFISSSFG